MILRIASRQKRQLIDITEAIELPLGDGLANVFVRHTTSCITVLDFDPGTDNDYLKALDSLTPQLE